MLCCECLNAVRYHLIIITLITTVHAISCSGQEVDSAWISKNYFPALATDTGLALPAVKLIDESGKQIDLSAYKGKKGILVFGLNQLLRSW